MARNDSERRGSNDEIEGYDRRSFMAVAGVAGGFGVFARGSGASGIGHGGRFTKNNAASDDSDSDENDGDDGDDGDDEGNADLPTGTEALLGYIEANYGERLSESDLESIEADIAADLEAVAAIDAVSLENSDAPAFDFTVYRGEE